MAKTITLLALSGLLVALVGCSERSPIGTVAGSDTPFPLAAGVIVPDSVKSATLYLYCSSPSLQTVNVHHATAPWSDSSVTWNSFAGSYDPGIHGSFAASTPGWKSIDIAPLVRDWISGALSNHGLLLGQATSLYPRGLFFSRENAFMQPYLTVIYGGSTGDTTVSFPVLRDATIDQSLPDNQLGFAQVLMTGWAADGGLKNQSLLYFDLPAYTPPSDDSTIINQPNDTTGSEPGDTTIVEPDDQGDLTCTHPWPWWLRHTGCRKDSPTDEVSALLPLWLGTPGGTYSVEIDNNCKAAEFLLRRNHDRVFPPVQPMVTELLAAKLNVAAGADDSAIADVITAVDLYLSDHAADNRRALGRADLKQIHEWYRWLHAYNVGEIGPGACDLEDEDGTDPEI